MSNETQQSDAAAQKPPSYRRKWFRTTNPPFQLKFLLFTFSIGAMTTLTSFVGLQIAIKCLAANTDQIRLMDWNQIEGMQNSQIRLIWWMMIIIAVVNITLTALISFLFSHRISGIMFRLRNELEAFADGKEVHPIVPRQDDFFGDVIAAANRLFEKPPK